MKKYRNWLKLIYWNLIQNRSIYVSVRVTDGVQKCEMLPIFQMMTQKHNQLSQNTKWNDMNQIHTHSTIAMFVSMVMTMMKWITLTAIHNFRLKHYFCLSFIHSNWNFGWNQIENQSCKREMKKKHFDHS